MKQYNVYIKNLYIHTYAILGVFHKVLQIICGCSKGYGSSAIVICCFQALTLDPEVIRKRDQAQEALASQGSAHYSDKIGGFLTVRLMTCLSSWQEVPGYQPMGLSVEAKDIESLECSSKGGQLCVALCCSSTSSFQLAWEREI